MKFLQLVVLLFLSNITYAQSYKSVTDFFTKNNITVSALKDSIDIDPYSFFPLKVGNSWQYSTQGDFYWYSVVTKDSVLQDSSHIFYFDNNEYWPTYRVDTNYNVFHKPEHKRGNDLLYKLDANQDERWWINKDSVNGQFVEGYIGQIDSIYSGYYLGKKTTFKIIGNYLEYNNSGVIEEFWDHDKILASGIGLVYEGKDGIQPDILVAAIINGDTLGTIVGVNENTVPEIPDEFILSQNYPNPFNPTTTITYQLPKKGQVVLKIYNSLGKEIKELVNNYQAEGNYTVKFDGSALPSGVYFYKIMVSNPSNGEHFTDTKKLILMK